MVALLHQYINISAVQFPAIPFHAFIACVCIYIYVCIYLFIYIYFFILILYTVLYIYLFILLESCFTSIIISTFYIS